MRGSEGIFGTKHIGTPHFLAVDSGVFDTSAPEEQTLLSLLQIETVRAKKFAFRPTIGQAQQVQS